MLCVFSVQLHPNLDVMDCSTPGFPVHQQLPELAQTHIHQVSCAIQPFHPQSNPSPAFSLSKNQGLFQWVSSSHQVAKELELQLQHQSFQWIFRTDFLQDWLIWSPCSPNIQKNIYFCFIDYTKTFDCVDHNKLWKILKEMGAPDHLTCLLRNLHAGQETAVRTGYGTTDWFQIRKGVHQGSILSPCLFNLCAEYIMQNAGLDEAQAGIQIARRNINNLRYADATTPNGRKWRTKELLEEGERREWKSWLKTQHSEN